MGNSSKTNNLLKFGFTSSKKKLGINYWRFFFNALDKNSAGQQMFYIEFEMINPWLSPDKALLGFKPRVAISQEDLQYALAGTESAKSIQTETIIQPSYCAIRVGILGRQGKQICSYFPVKDITFNSKPFEIILGDKYFSDEKISGTLKVSQEDLTEYPELLCDAGSASWDIKYVVNKDFSHGYDSNGIKWFPAGINTTFTGSITFDDKEYIIDPSRSYGSMERYWGKTLLEPWFHISSSNLVSNITGKHLFGSSFAVQGSFDGHVSFLSFIDDTDISFSLENSSKFSDLWSCNQMPVVEEIDENLLHWSVSINNKAWVIDIDVYSKITELCNRNLELPEGGRKVLNLLEGGTGTGEIKIYKKNKKTLEQIEFAKINNCICEFGHVEEPEL